MKSRLISLRVALFAAMALVSASAQQTATWTGGSMDNNWNTPGNWDVGVPGVGTNAVIGAGYTVNYNSPMAAGSFGSLTLNGVLNINAAAFVVGASGNGAASLSGSTARLFLNNGGAISLTNGGLTLDNSAGAALSGGSLSIQGALRLGNTGATGSLGMMTNNGATLNAASTSINAGGASSTSLLAIGGGVNNLGNVTIRRYGGSSSPGLGYDGLAISNGVVTMTSLVVNSNNSFASMLVTGGAVTNTGTFIVGQQNGGNSRQTTYTQVGGLVVSTIPEGVRLCVTNGTQTARYALWGGTNIAEKFVLGDATNGATTVVATFTNLGNLYLGSGGFTTNNVTSYTIALNNGGTTGAKADWSTSLPLLLNSGTHVFNAADPAGAAHNITLNGRVRGGGGLNKTGPGLLTLNGTNDYTGATIVSQGRLVLGSTGSISNTAQISISAGAVLDASAVNNAALLSSQTLSGNGSVAGALTTLSGSTLRPGGLLAAGTLTFSNGLTQSGGVNNSFDLSQDPTGTISSNDMLNVVGNLNASGTNTIQITELSGPLPAGAAYKLIHYTVNFNGGVTNFSLAGANGVLSNDASGGVIYLMIQTAVRAPTNVVWLGGLAPFPGPQGGAWDTQTTSNWLNGAQRDIFVPGDRARFDDTGATNNPVPVIGSVGPAELVVDTASNYTWTGNGSIDGSGSLVKTNSGTLTILTTNGYPGATFIGGGAIEALKLANGGSASSIGASVNDATNLQFWGSTLRYLGPTAATDRSATLNGAGATFDITNTTTTLTLNGSLTGPGALVKAGPGTLVLTAANSQAGGTVISNGVLALSGAGALTGSAMIDVLANAALDVSSRSDGKLSLGDGQTLTGEGVVRGSVTAQSGAIVSPGQNTAAIPAGSGAIGLLTITNALVLQPGSTTVMDLYPALGTNDGIAGLARITYGSSLDLSHGSGTYNAGDSFKLFSAASYSESFASISPTPGHDSLGRPLAWDTSRLRVDGTLRVIILQRPSIESIACEGTALIVRGTNGAPYASYYVLYSTNVALQLDQWPRLQTNVFQSDGTFSFTNTMDPNIPRCFFILQVP